MSTAPLHHPPLEEVFAPRDAEQVADYLARGAQRRRWGRFLAARQALLSLVGRARDAALRIVEQYRLGGAVWAAQASLGWLAGGYRLLRRGIEVVGMASAVGMVIASPTARNVAARAGRLVASALHAVTSTVARIGASVLSWFGSPGRNVAARIGGAGRSVGVRAKAVLAPVVRAVRAALDVRSTVIRTVGAVARERAVGRLLGVVLPQPWAAITRVLAGVLLLPATVRRQAAAMAMEGLERVLRHRLVDGVVSTEPPTGGAAPTAPRFSSTATSVPVTTPASPTRVPERDEDWPGVQLRLDEQLDNTEGVLPPRRPARYPAAAKRNSGPRR